MFKPILTFIVLFLLTADVATAQSSSKTYMKIDYLQVETEQQDQFLSYIENELKPFKKERIEKEDIKNVKVYRVLFSGDHSYKYNYIIQTVAPSIRAFDYHNNSSIDLLSKNLVNNKFLVQQSELWEIKNSQSRVGNIVSPYLMMDYMSVNLGMELEYQMLEDEVAKPIHIQRMANNEMDRWEMYQLITPGGNNYGYNFSTGNYFSSLANIQYGFNEELIRDRNPNVNLMEFFNKIWSTRDLVKSEVWYLIDSVTAEVLTSP